MKRTSTPIKYVILAAFILACFTCPSYAAKCRIALIHSFEPEYPVTAKATKLLNKELRALGLDCELREYFLDCDRYQEGDENRLMADFVDDLSAWDADLIAVLDDQATYALMACHHPVVHTIPVVFSGVNYPNYDMLCQYPNITGFMDEPDYLSTIRMIENIMGKSRICLMNGLTFLDRKIWRTLNEQCQGQNFEMLVADHATYDVNSTYHKVKEGEVMNPILRRRHITRMPDTTKIVRMSSDSVEIRRVMWLGRGDHTVFLYTKRDYTTKRIATLFDNPTFETINEGFGFTDFMLGGYFTPLESQIQYMAAGIKERLEGRMPQNQVVQCDKQHVLNWHVLEKYQIPMEDLPEECIVMFVPFNVKYHYHILAASVMGASIVMGVIVILAFSFLRERRRKRAALRSLQYEHETLCLAIEGNNTYVWRLEGDTVLCDSQFYELIDHPRSRLSLDEVMTYIHPDDLKNFRKNLSAMERRLRHKGQYRCRFNSRYEWWEFSYNTIHTPGHAPIITGLLHSVQEQKDREEELIQARKLAEHAELKQSFLNNMSHEIRTPLNAITGFSNMLVNSPEFSDEQRQEFIDIINLNTRLLLKLVEDVLELSRIESGNMLFQYQQENVSSLLDNVYQTHRLLIRPELQFIKECPAEDITISIDSIRLIQILTNFLNNANKFTECGYIKLGYCCPPESGEVHIYVEDTGMGIPYNEHKMIFERFYKHNEFSQGVGLGLSICGLIVEKMGGHIELQSEEGRGSRFTVVLPCNE